MSGPLSRGTCLLAWRYCGRGQRLLMVLAWWCPGPAQPVDVNGKEALQWTFVWTPPSPNDIGGARLEPEVMKIATASQTGFSYEERCRQLEITFADPELDVVCVCCASVESSNCDSCRHATGWHHCCANARRQRDLLWRAGSLHAGHLDIQRVLVLAA